MPPNIDNEQDVHPPSLSPMQLSASALSTPSPSVQNQLQNGITTFSPACTLPDPNDIVPPQSPSSGPGSSRAAHSSNPSTPANVTNDEQSFLDGHQDPQTLKT